MSPWLRDELRVLVCPDQVSVQAVRHTLTLRGPRREEQEAGTASCGPGADVLAALASLLPSAGKRRLQATVILSNQLLRYVLIPWRAELNDEEEELAYARHCLARIHGKASLAWELRLAAQAPGLPRLASALDTGFLAGLRRVFREGGIPLRSIQPHLMAAFNTARRRLGPGNCWLVLLEPGHLCVAMLQRGQWSAVQCARLRQPWLEQLVPLLERECYLADDAAVPQDVYVGALDGSAVTLTERLPWRFHGLPSGS